MSDTTAATSSSLPDAQDNNERMLTDIQNLQQMEQQLFQSLESMPNLTPAQQTKLIEKMNQLSTMRINLYASLGNANNYFEVALTTSVDTLKEQAVAIDIVESELNAAKQRLKLLEEEKNNQIRLIEINTYYGDKYAEHATLMKIALAILVVAFLLTLLHSKGLLPTALYFGLLSLASFVGGFFFWKRYASIIMRDNMNYQTYDWGDPATSGSSSSSSSSSSSTTTDPWSTTAPPSTACVGDACCSAGQSWDAAMNQCVGASTVVVVTTSTPPPPTSAASTTESFVNQVLTKSDPYRKHGVDYNLAAPLSFGQ